MTKRAIPIGAPHCFSLPGEEWKPLPLNPNYWASSLGRIASGPGRTTLGRVLAQHPTTSGRLRVSLGTGPKGSIKREVHRLICEAFHGLPPDPLLEAAHNDGDALNNLPSNLRWATHRENIADKVRHGTQLRGSRVSRSKLTEGQVADLRRAVAAGADRFQVARTYGVHKNHVDAIVRGDCWSHVPCG